MRNVWARTGCRPIVLPVAGFCFVTCWNIWVRQVAVGPVRGRLGREFVGAGWPTGECHVHMADGMRPVPTVRHTARRPRMRAPEGGRRYTGGPCPVYARAMQGRCPGTARRVWTRSCGTGPAHRRPTGLTSMSITFLLISKRLVSCGGGTAPDVGGRRKSRRLYAARSRQGPVVIVARPGPSR